MTPEPEEWRPVVGYEGLFEVSNHGRVKSLDRTITRSDGQKRRFKGVMLTPNTGGRNGRPKIWVPRGGGRRGRLVIQRAVLQAFVGPNPPERWHACHRDGNYMNNHLDNLYWGTPSENAQDTLRHGHHAAANKTHCKRNHEFTPENTLVRNGESSRRCRECRTLRNAGLI